MRIDSCVCYNRSFRRIYHESIRDGIDTVEDLKRLRSICDKCCMCNPYLDVTFKTGQFIFDCVIPKRET